MGDGSCRGFDRSLSIINYSTEQVEPIQNFRSTSAPDQNSKWNVRCAVMIRALPDWLPDWLPTDQSAHYGPSIPTKYNNKKSSNNINKEIAWRSTDLEAFFYFNLFHFFFFFLLFETLLGSFRLFKTMVATLTKRYSATSNTRNDTCAGSNFQRFLNGIF